jgi:hypothetical protein
MFSQSLITFILNNKEKINNIFQCAVLTEGLKKTFIASMTFFLICAVGLWVLQPLTGLLYQPWMIGDGDCGEIGGMKIGRGN